MDAIYVTEPGSYLRREGESLKIMMGGRLIDQIPAKGLKRLTLIGYVSLSGGVLDFLIANRVETVFITPTGRFRARLALDEHAHVALRKAQYLRLSDPAFALKTAKGIVNGKTGNMMRFLLLRARQYGDEQIRLSAAKLKALAFLLNSVTDMDALRGMEGAAARIYFSVFDRLIKNDQFSFKGRNRRPPLDPVNAMLSFIYTMLTNEVLSAVKSSGLDPYLGALHEISYGRPSLACDLVEEYRSFLGDRLVLGLINRKLISPDDFVYRKDVPKEFTDDEEMKKKRPVEMKPAINRALIKAYEEMMTRSIKVSNAGNQLTYRTLLLQQARDFGSYLKEEKPDYTPFSWEG